ncbi:helix-turn-helix domain-containing protein [Nocardioides sp. zg-536]|uniref:Helix-turn-helix domain-containing protein n=1 Tax=Nocardioides faecalis TaxID=2803858 RepID=A0A938YBU4_9ACTN|nr:helix-turn-helix domain-containing protein [Nocardioides faecalis]MBM9461768.1 helix-turn-helix domain-containing protein [Nocardioides faecalis]MBS4752234.1 helix-turn-helix domain-containing protein [Nocardioides faecalis]QVI58967.1 helix-turn-helix domain-containing protein [Nocardioides faecalis]
MAAAETSQTFSRGLDVLQLLASSPHGRTPSQLAAELGLSRTIIYRLVATLVEHRLVRRAPDGTVSMAAGALALTQHVLGSVRESTRVALADLAREAGATAHFSILDGEDILAVAVEEPPFTTFHVSYRVGARTPRDRGALGVAIAAAARGEEGMFESEGQLVPGAHGIVVSLPRVPGPPAALGLVTLAGQESAAMRQALRTAAARLAAELG